MPIDEKDPYAFLGDAPNIKAALNRADEVQQKQDQAVEARTDKYARRPLRAAALAALSGENPLTAGYDSIDQDKNVSGQDVAHKLLERGEQLGLPLDKENGVYSREEGLGQGINNALDVRNFNPEGLVTGTIRPNTKALPGSGGRVAQAITPGPKAPTQVPQSQKYYEGLQEVNKPISGSALKDKIERIQMAKQLGEFNEIADKAAGTTPSNYWDDVQRRSLERKLRANK